MSPSSRILTFKFIAIFTLLACSLACDNGMYADSNGTCVQCDISCSTCRSSEGCSTCYDQMYLIARGNTIVCDVCYNVNLGCDVCLTATKCQSCSVGYYMQQDSTCAPCNNLTPNCILCFDGNATRCISCEQSYQLVGEVCVGNGSSTNSSSAGSSSANQGNNQGSNQGNTQGSNQGQSQGTIQQSQGNQPSQGNTQGQSQLNNQQNSTSNSSNGGCDPSRVSINGVCYPTIPFCQTYSQTDGTCTLCASIFNLINGYCLPSSLISSNTPPQQSQTTTSGNSPSGPTSNTIYSPTPCSSRQYFSNGVCMDVGVQCTQFDLTTGACYACTTGFSVYNGLCVQIAVSTTTTAQASTTTAQASTTTTQPSTTTTTQPSATSMPANCQLANPVDPTKCLSCVSGYTIVDALPGVCYQIN